jgi:two-component system, OmpR family, alkaline phosphatase synthesis response regulator PhoP
VFSEARMNGTILVVDDEPQITRLAQDYLARDGFRVLVARDGGTALGLARQEQPDLVVLDLNLPGIDGLEVCRKLRRTSDVPIVMLTARVEETDRLIGLELGADDYIVKPFSPRELVARVRAVLRRARGEVRQQQILHAGPLEIDLEGHSARRNGEAVALTRSEFSLLAVLAQNPGAVFSREQLLERIHGVAYDGFDRSVDSHIKNLRRKLEADPLSPELILTVYGIGYKFAEEAAE